jgi:hypothetical protein
MNTTNTQNVETTEHPAGRALRTMGSIALVVATVALPIIGLIGLGLAGFVLYKSICHLGTGPLAVDASSATLVGASMVATLAVLIVAGVVLSILEKRRTLVLALMFTGMWLALAIVMALIDTWLSVATIRPDATLLQVGVFIYSALPALPIIPLVILIGSAAHERRDQYPTLAAAFGALGFTILKLALAVAMFVFEAFYGITIGVNALAAVFAALLNATAFSMALGSTEAAAKDGDRGGVRLWGVVSVLYAVLMFAIAAEAIITFSAQQAATNAGAATLSALHAPAWLETLAQWAFVSSIGLSALLIALMFWRKSARSLAGADHAAQEQLTIKRPEGNRIAGAIRAARSNAGEIRDAARGAPALPRPTVAMMGSEARQPEPAVIDPAPDPASDPAPDQWTERDSGPTEREILDRTQEHMTDAQLTELGLNPLYVRERAARRKAEEELRQERAQGDGDPKAAGRRAG